MDLFLGEMNQFEKILKSSYIAPWYIMLAGKLYARAGMSEHADTLLQDISSKMNATNAEDQRAFNLLKGEIELLNGNYDNAIELFEIVCLSRRDDYNLESLAYAHFSNGDLDKAIAAYEQVIGMTMLGWEGQDCWLLAHAQLGKLCEERGDIERAVRYYEKLLDIWKDAEDNLPLLVEIKKRLSELKMKI